jgi:S-methylmethionine-dependent homocysteine/selenocysteine methylase
LALHRDALPQLDADRFLTDGGLETTLIFDDGLEVPDFAAFVLLDDAAGRDALVRYYDSYVEIALRDRVGIVLETPTWRANPDWAERLGFTLEDLDRLNVAAVELLAGVRRRRETAATPIVVSGCLGPRGDGYAPDLLMEATEAEAYHRRQVDVFVAAGADLVSALTMTHPAEAIGIANAARAAGIPVVISFTVETDGILPSGHSLGEAIGAVDAATGSSPIYYMVNCAHPTHFASILTAEPWVARIRGIRANASRRSHAELDEAEELDAGDPDELAAQYVELRRAHPQLSVLGGCCGTSDRHIAAISAACART